MNDALALPLVLPLVALTGALIGGLFFGGLHWTLRRAFASRRPALWVGASLLLRMGGAAAGFVLVSAGSWQRLLACLLGFWAARWLVLRLTREPAASSAALSNPPEAVPCASATRAIPKERPHMQIQINTDNHIDGNAALSSHVETVVTSTLRHVKDHITRVEVHLSDENGGKSGTEDKRCLMEARLKSHEPVAVTAHAGSIHQAVDGAARKLKAALETVLGRLDGQRRQPTAGAPDPT